MGTTGFIFANISEDSGIVVDVPAGMQSKTALLETLGAGLHFPDYYGVNWDAFEECICDLSWLPEHDITIRHIDLPLIGEGASARTYLLILRDAVARWAKESSHSLIVVFPPEVQGKIESLVGEQ